MSLDLSFLLYFHHPGDVFSLPSDTCLLETHLLGTNLDDGVIPRINPHCLQGAHSHQQGDSHVTTATRGCDNCCWRMCLGCSGAQRMHKPCPRGPLHIGDIDKGSQGSSGRWEQQCTVLAGASKQHGQRGRENSG